MKRYRLKRNTGAAAAAVLAALIGLQGFAAPVVETDEFGAAYVLNEDGTKNYNDVPPMDISSAETTQPGVIYDTNDYDLGLPGPTMDPATIGIPAGMSAERYAQLNDSVIEWDEVEDLVVNWNPTYTKYFNQANASLTEMRGAYEEFNSQMQEQIDIVDENIELIRAAQNMSGASDAGTSALSSQLHSAQNGKRQILGQLSSTKRSLYYAGATVQNALRPVRHQMISVVESLIISYKTLETNRTMVAEQVKLYEELYNMQAAMQNQGLGTAAATQTYFNQLNTAVKTLADIDAGLSQLKKTIAVQCGYDPATEITIADLPAPDVHYLDGRDYEADKKQAVDGNQTVISAGSLGNYEYSSVGMELRNMGENEARGKAAAAFDAIRNELERQVILTDSSAASLKKADLTANSSRLKYEMGMVGRAEYEGLRMQQISYQAAARINDLNLHQAIRNYHWALLGVMSVE